MELLTEVKDVVVALFVAVQGLVGPVFELLYPEDPTTRAFLAGMLVMAGMTHRRKIMSFTRDKIPVIGLAIAYVGDKLIDGVEFVVGKVRDAGVFVKANTWDRVVRLLAQGADFFRKKKD